MPTKQQLNEWNDAFTRLQRVESHQRMKKHLAVIVRQIEYLDEVIPLFKPPTNPREDLIQHHDKLNREMLIKQKARIDEKISELEKQIQQDMSAAK